MAQQSSGLAKVLGLPSRQSEAPDQVQGGEVGRTLEVFVSQPVITDSPSAGTATTDAIAYPDVLTKEDWKKRLAVGMRLLDDDLGIGERLNEIQSKFQELGLDRELPSYEGLDPEEFLKHAKGIKETNNYQPFFELLDEATAHAAAAAEGVDASLLTGNRDVRPVTSVTEALLDLKRQVTERREAIDGMPKEFKRKLKQDPVFVTTKKTCESISDMAGRLLDATNRIRSNPTVAQVQEKFGEGKNPARDILSTVTFWKQVIVKRWHTLAEQAFPGDIREECINDALSSAGRLRIKQDLQASAQERRRQIEEIEASRTRLEEEARAIEEGELQQGQRELGESENTAKEAKRAAAERYLLNAGREYTREKYSKTSRKSMPQRSKCANVSEILSGELKTCELRLKSRSDELKKLKQGRRRRSSTGWTGSINRWKGLQNSSAVTSFSGECSMDRLPD